MRSILKTNTVKQGLKQKLGSKLLRPFAVISNNKPQGGPNQVRLSKND